MTQRGLLSGAFGLVLLLAGSAAQAQHFDALIYQEFGRVQTGGIDVDCFGGGGLPGCDPNGIPSRVYEAELEEMGISPGLFGTAEEPGFFSVQDGAEGNLPGTGSDNLPGSAAHSIDIILAPNSPVAGASILYWDGIGSVTWTAVPNSEFFDIEGNGGSGGILNGTNAISGITLDSTDGTGAFDTHPDYLLFGPGGTVDPTPGFYTIFGRTNIAGLDSSAAWASVFDFGVEDEVLHEAAIDDVASFIPEPATGALFGVGLFALARKRREELRA